MMDLNITNEELNALKTYINKDYKAIDQMLISNCETDIALLSEDVENEVVQISYLRDNVIEYLNNIKLIYRLILKIFYGKKYEKSPDLYRGTNLSEVERLKNEIYIDKMLITTLNSKVAKNKYSSIWNRPTCIRIILDSDIPYIFLKDVLENDSEDVLILPFTKIKNISVDEEEKLDVNLKTLKNYSMYLEKQELDGLTEDERNGLYNYILDNSYVIKRKIEQCIELEKENTVNFENIRKLEQLLNKYENNEDEEDFEGINSNTNNVYRVQTELENLKQKSNELFEKRKSNIDFVNIWKRNIAVYMIAECKEIEKEFEEIKKNYELEKETENNKSLNQENEKENDEKQETNSNEIKEDTIVVPLIDVEEDTIDTSEKDSPEYILKQSALENINTCKKLISDINLLISKQQNHAKIAKNLGATYSALNNAFEMRKNAEKLLEMLENINLKEKSYLLEEKNKFSEMKIEEFSKINLEIGTLFNYLNNPKIAIVNSKALRFDEMAIIEENELKRNIAEKIREICGEAELKKLKDDFEIIEEKGTFSKILGIFTGQNKLDECMEEQIEIRQNAIRKTLSKRLSLAYNYSIHEMMAKIKMFIEENEDDELVEDDVTDLKAIAEELKRNYVILDSKIDSIIYEKEGKNLPVNDKKVSKAEMLEIETYRFLNKYEYDIEKNQEEPKYQDTMANEIYRIIEYINSIKI